MVDSRVFLKMQILTDGVSPLTCHCVRKPSIYLSIVIYKVMHPKYAKKFATLLCIINKQTQSIMISLK